MDKFDPKVGSHSNIVNNLRNEHAGEVQHLTDAELFQCHDEFVRGGGADVEDFGAFAINWTKS